MPTRVGRTPANMLTRRLSRSAIINPVNTDASPRFTLGQRIMLALVPPIIWVLLQVVGRTWRFETIAEEGATALPFGEGAQGDIFCFWHQCVLPCTFYFHRTHATIIVSQSFDGELITRILERFGYRAARGSSSRGAREGLLGLQQVIEEGKPAIFTADGPRGPVYRTKMGPVKLASMTGARIGAFHLEPTRAWKMNSWDRFMVPMPFTRIVVSWARWTEVPADLAPDGLEQQRELLNDAIERARLRALEYFGKPAAHD
jgi:lysophospholipid acyltransferase (LPLAT)-like uncharacterized protein